MALGAVVMQWLSGMDYGRTFKEIGRETSNLSRFGRRGKVVRFAGGGDSQYAAVGRGVRLRNFNCVRRLLMM